MSPELKEALASALDGAVVAFLAVLAPTLIIIARKLAQWLEARLTAWAIDQGVASAEELGRAEKQLRVDGWSKQQHAKRVARSLAPKAIGKLEETQLEELVNAGVARLRPSLQTPPSIPPGASLIPVQIVGGSDPPTPLIIPRAPAVPTEHDPVTIPATPHAKQRDLPRSR